MTPNQLVEIELIKRCKYKYLRLLDQRRIDELREVMTDDCTASYSDGEYCFDGLDDILDFLVGTIGSAAFLSSHTCHHPEIDLTGPDTATGIWRLEDQVVIGDYDVKINGAAFYEDRYVKTADGWKISHTGYRRTFEEMHPLSAIEGYKVSSPDIPGVSKVNDAEAADSPSG